MSNCTLLIGWPKKNARRFRSRKVLWAISFFFGRAFFHRCFHRNFKHAIFWFCLDPHSKLLRTLSPTRFFNVLRRVLRPLYVPAFTGAVRWLLAVVSCQWVVSGWADELYQLSRQRRRALPSIRHVNGRCDRGEVSVKRYRALYSLYQ